MAISRYSALAIHNKENDIRCEVGGQHKETKKWSAVINLYHGGFFHTTIISSVAEFESPEIAVEHMKTIVEAIRVQSIEDLLK